MLLLLLQRKNCVVGQITLSVVVHKYVARTKPTRLRNCDDNGDEKPETHKKYTTTNSKSVVRC